MKNLFSCLCALCFMTITAQAQNNVEPTENQPSIETDKTPDITLGGTITIEDPEGTVTFGSAIVQSGGAMIINGTLKGRNPTSTLKNEAGGRIDICASGTVITNSPSLLSEEKPKE